VKRNRCMDCGRIISKHNSLRRCKKCWEKHNEEVLAANRAEIADGKCPRCGRGLRRNLAITGWIQCEQFGAEGFRADDSQPSCSFQTFIA